MKKRIFGYELVLDLHDCDPKIIRSRSKIKQFSDEICKLLEMKKYGKALIPHFGHNDETTSGYSLVQLIETSSITAHFSELWNTVYLNIFSCKSYDPEKAAKFAKDFFGAKRVKKTLLERK